MWVATIGSGASTGMVYKLTGYNLAAATVSSSWSGFSTPKGITGDNQGNIYVSNSAGYMNGYVSQINNVGLVSLYWSGGYNSPLGIIWDLTYQLLYVASNNNGWVYGANNVGVVVSNYFNNNNPKVSVRGSLFKSLCGTE